MIKKKYTKPLVVLLLLNLLSSAAWSQADEFDLGDSPSNAAPGGDLSLPTEPGLPSASGPAPSPKNTVKEPTLEPTPEPAIKESPREEIAVPREMPKKRPPEVTPTIIGSAGSDPDFKKEEKFHNIYKKYNEQPTNVEQWEKVIGNRASEAYVIQKDDTLWDLSKTLFDDPNYWPKIWSLNKETVYNPHQINPKLHLRFYPGTKSQPPTLGVTEKPVPENPIEEIAKNDVAVPAVEETDPQATPKPRVRVPVLKKIPPSLPEYAVVGIAKPKLTIDSKPKMLPSPLMALPYYITDQSLNEVGKVKDTEIGSSSAFEFQYVFVELQEPTQKVYTVVRENSDISLGLTSSASHIEVQGEIEVVNKVDDSSNLYRAIVKRALLRVEVGSKLIPGQMPFVDTSLGPEKTASLANIIGGQYGKTNLLYAASSYVFLDQGSSQGYRVGDVLPVFAAYKNRNAKSSANINERKIGLVKIVKVADSVSTGFVLNSMEDIQKGDVVGSSPGRTASDVSSAVSVPSLDSAEGSLDNEIISDEPVPELAPDQAPAEQSETPEDELTL